MYTRVLQRRLPDLGKHFSVRSLTLRRRSGSALIDNTTVAPGLFRVPVGNRPPGDRLGGCGPAALGHAGAWGGDRLGPLDLACAFLRRRHDDDGVATAVVVVVAEDKRAGRT